jgi:hypothetical protein
MTYIYKHLLWWPDDLHLYTLTLMTYIYKHLLWWPTIIYTYSDDLYL